MPKFTCEWLRRRLRLVSADAVPALRERGMLVPQGGHGQTISLTIYKMRFSRSCPVFWTRPFFCLRGAYGIQALF